MPSRLGSQSFAASGHCCSRGLSRSNPAPRTRRPYRSPSRQRRRLRPEVQESFLQPRTEDPLFFLRSLVLWWLRGPGLWLISISNDSQQSLEPWQQLSRRWGQEGWCMERLFLLLWSRANLKDRPCLFFTSIYRKLQRVCSTLSSLAGSLMFNITSSEVE